MMRSAKRYTTVYKKRVDVEKDMYIPKWSPEGLPYCKICGSVYYRQRWTLKPPEEIRDWAEFREDVRPTLCPACRKIHDDYPYGELRLVGLPLKEKAEVFRLLRNEEERAREKNPLGRIMRIEADDSGWRVHTTTEKLAQRLGRCLEKARGGKVAYKWSHNNKFVRVLWQKEGAKDMLKGLIAVFIGIALFFKPIGAVANLVGQQRVCGKGPQRRTVTLTAIEKIIDLGEGLKAQGWTFDGQVPGPTIEACEEDMVKVLMKNDDSSTTAHGIDSHAFRIDAAKFGPVEAGKTLVFEKKLDTPGVFMYHCAAGPVTDQHIKMGMYGVMIVYQRKKKLKPARELVITEAGIYGEPDKDGMIFPSTERVDENRPYFVVFNGQLKHEPIKVKAGELIRVYFVHAGPGSSAFHVIGTILDRSHGSGNPRNVVYGVQTYDVPAGSGAIFEFIAPEVGSYLLVDHNLLSQVPNGLAIPFVAQ